MGSVYVEHVPHAALRGDVACTWSQTVDGDTTHEQRVVPDACVDVVWLDDTLRVVGPDTGPVVVSLAPGSRVVGLRFRPGHAPAFVGTTAAELADTTVPLGALWGRDADRLADQVATAPDDATARAVLETAMLARTRGGTGRASTFDVDAVVVRLDRPGARVADVASEVARSPRDLHRRCVEVFGYGPKVLDRVLRFQRFLRASRRPDLASVSRARIAAECGYSDEAHLARDCRALGGVAPGTLAPRAR